MKKCINESGMTGVVSIVLGKTPEAFGEEKLPMPVSRRYYWHLGIAIALEVSGAIAFSANRANSQSNIVPDRTLGNESSVVVPNFNGLPVEVIDGGALRGQNLFHSFREFNVSTGRGAYFFSPNSNIQNILARVTGNNPSQILGTLGTFGNSQPNLFLINPNGIIFGPNASLDIGGSFVGTTANAIRLGNTGLLSASHPRTSNLLSINPSAFFFNSLASQGQIVNRSTATSTVLGDSTSGVQVPDGRSLLLVGGNVKLDGGRLFAPGGRVELGGVAGTGRVGLNANGNELRLSFPTDVARADVSLMNGAEVNVRAGGGGSIAINARNLEILQVSKVRAGIDSGLGSPDSKAGDIEVNATDTTTVAGDSFITNSVQPEGVGKGGDINITTGSLFVTGGAQVNSVTFAFGQGDAGSVTILARDTVSFDGTDPNRVSSGVSSTVQEGAVGNGGRIDITTGSLFVTNGAKLVAGTYGQGNAGSVRIRATDIVRFDGGSGAGSAVGDGAVGNGGNIDITTGSLLVSNDAFLSSSTLGQGKAGSVRIRATDSVRFVRGYLSSSVEEGAVGDGGDIDITTGSLSLSNGAFLSADTAGKGNAGSVKIRATNTVSFDRDSTADSAVIEGAVGNGGEIDIITGSLSLSNGASLIVGTAGKGNAGSVRIRATDTVSFDASSVLSAVGSHAVGNGGDIDITTGSLSLSKGAGLIASAFGQGNAGSVRIRATDTVSFDGEGSGTRSTVGEGVVGKGGDIDITTSSLSLSNHASLSTSTFGQGNAGSVRIRATDTVSFDGDSGAASQAGKGAVGNGGEIDITTGSLSLSNGAFLLASTFGQGKAGSVRIIASDTVNFDGKRGASSSVGEGAVGNGGDIDIITGSLSLSNGASLSAATNGQGKAGSVKIIASDTVSFDRSSAFSAVGEGAVGNGGDIDITTGTLSLSNGAGLIANTYGQGNAGSVRIRATDTVSFDGSSAFSAVGEGAVGNGGSIDITSKSLSLTDAFISSESLGTGTAGDIKLQTDQNLKMNRSSILSSTQAGDGGNIKLQVGDVLLMRNNSKISTTAGIAGAGGNGGNININSDFVAAVSKENSDITANAYNGRGGNINISTSGIYGLKYRERETPLSDITASSQFGVNGEFQLDLLTNVDPSRGLTELPTNVVDATRQIDRRCTPAGTGQERSSFTITGRGGLPPSPNDPLRGEAVVTNWVSLDSDVENTTPRAKTAPSSSAPKQLVEAQGWVINEKGQVVLTASAPKVTPQNEWLSSPECNPPQTPKAPQS